MTMRNVLGELALDATLLDVLTELQGTLIVNVDNDPAAIPLSAATATVTSADPLTISPATGNALRLWWVSALPDPDNSSNGTVSVTLGARILYHASAVSHRQRFDGAADEMLTVSVSGGGDYPTTVHYEEHTP